MSSSAQFFIPEYLCNSGIAVSSSPANIGENQFSVGGPHRSYGAPSSSSSSSALMRRRVSRFLRRVLFLYQNGSRSDFGSDPFNSGTWVVLECLALVIQVLITTYTLSVTMAERPVWPMRSWLVLYEIGCAITLYLLYWRYRLFCGSQGDDVEDQRTNIGGESRSLQLMNKCRTYMELFFALWFVMGNVWILDSPFGSFHGAPKLHMLCISLLAWNAICYSFPFLLFVLLCCFVPLISVFLGYNLDFEFTDRGASDDQITNLPKWRYKEVDSNLEECCICLAKYREKEEIRQLPCSHTFHLKCIDQWLRILSCCPLCKKDLQS